MIARCGAFYLFCPTRHVRNSDHFVGKKEAGPEVIKLKAELSMKVFRLINLKLLTIAFFSC